MSYTPRSLFRLLEDIDAHRLLLPHIQRPFVWEREQMGRLFDSLMREYPIQTFLFWRTKEEIRARHFMPAIDFDADLSALYDIQRSAKDVEKVFVLDGQQRLQTLHAIFRGGIRSDLGTTEEAYCDIAAGDKEVENGDVLHSLTFSSIPLDLPMFRVRDLAEKHANGNPLTIADELNDLLEAKLQEPNEQRKLRERRVRSNLQQLHSILNHDKHFWIDELDGVAKQYPYRRILEIFVRVNSGGTKLTSGDLMFAAMKEGWDDIEERVEQMVDLLNGGKLGIDSDFVLKCLLLAHGEGAEIQTEKFYGVRGEELIKRIEQSWDKAEKAFQQLRDFIVHDVRVFSDKLVRSYNSLIPVFDFLFINPFPNEANRLLMGAYYHKAQLFNWYSSATDSVLNALHSIVGKDSKGVFPLSDVKKYFASRGYAVELQESHLHDTRLRTLILNIVYCDRWGNSPFDVAYKGNEPHVDHIYPQYMLRSRLGCGSSAINDIGNLRFLGATDNIRKRAEFPDSYFARLKLQGIPIEKHLLVPEFSYNPSALTFDNFTYDTFRERRRTEIWKSAKRIVDPEISGN
ncbi:MAG: DUF262 domain-containing protein [Chloroflexi bacterium]|nr:DUF262 domain-containing protein [Chloroflexota bacterium]